ncbi:MAG: elongation factor Ts [Candidatus Paceibacterota bacterium]|jgi:elongation factor Ts
MQITTEQIKELRDETGVSVMQCKKALEEAGGDMEKAKIILRKISKQSADKKLGRTLGAGVVASYIHGNGGVGTMIELLCETDFVARNEEFKALARDLAMHITALAPQYLKIEDVKEEDKVTAKELFEKDMDMSKPQEMRNKIMEGKLAAYFGEKVLLQQAFIKNPEVTIGGLIEQANQKFGERTEIGRFVRFSIN